MEKIIDEYNKILLRLSEILGEDFKIPDPKDIKIEITTLGNIWITLKWVEKNSGELIIHNNEVIFEDPDRKMSFSFSPISEANYLKFVATNMGWKK